LSFFSRTAQFFSAQKSLLLLQLEVKKLREENATLQEKSASMRRGMRRCVTCDYRLDFKERQGKAPILDAAAVDASK
jgi:FtsZ-binding cell division protein ZapB